MEDSSVPVKMYSAVEDRSVHFRLLHASDHVPVKQRYVNPRTGDPVAPEDIKKGLEVERGVFVAFEPDELEAVEPKASRDIEILRFVDPAEISHPWYDRPYYLGPDGRDELYAALAAAMEAENKEGVVRWVMRKKAYIGALRARDGYLVLSTLRHAEEVVRLETLSAPTRGATAGEKKLAMQLIGALEAEFDPSEFADDYREQVLDLVERKAAGETIELPRVDRRKKETDALADALKKSLDAARRRKVG